jgi:hypothetical protein
MSLSHGLNSLHLQLKCEFYKELEVSIKSPDCLPSINSGKKKKRKERKKKENSQCCTCDSPFATQYLERAG